MRVQRFFFVLLVFYCLRVSSQNKKFRYGFKEIPQFLLENPGGEVKFTKHIGVPFLSGAYLNIATSNILISNLFRNGGKDIEDRYQRIINKLSARDFLTVNEQLDIINLGYKLKSDRDYINFGFYQEFDFIANNPKDIAHLYYQKNQINAINQIYNIDHINYKGEFIGVFHFGVSRKVNSKLTVGARAKLYSGVFNVQSFNNKGQVTKRLGQNNEDIYTLKNTDVAIYSSGISGISKDNFLRKAVKNVASLSNLGLGLDLGFTYHLRDDLTLTGSILDLGFINYTKDITTYKIKQTIADVDLIVPPSNQTTNTWNDLHLDTNSQISIDTIQTAYRSFRSPKIYTSFFYKFDKDFVKRRSCYSVKKMNDGDYLNEVGVQLYTILRPIKPQLAVSLFYNRKVTNYLKAKVMYTVDSYSFYNIGVGFSSQFGKFNFYASADNLLGVADIYNSKKTAVSLGMNLIFE